MKLLRKLGAVAAVGPSIVHSALSSAHGPNAKFCADGKLPSECGMCKFVRLAPSWQDRFWWLECREKVNGWRVGCGPCSEAGNIGRLAEFQVHTVYGLQAVNFKKHANGLHHKAAVAAHLADDNIAAQNGGPLIFIKLLGGV